MQAEVSRYERGLSNMRAIFGPGVESELERLAETSPDLVRCLIEIPFATHAPFWI